LFECLSVCFLFLQSYILHSTEAFCFETDVAWNVTVPSQTSIVELFLVFWNRMTLSTGTVVFVDAVTEWQAGRGWCQPGFQVRSQPGDLITCQPSALISVSSRILKPRPK
jgi:hypothetical protein